MKCKTSARNNILRKLSNTKWGAKPATIITTALVLYYIYLIAGIAPPGVRRATTSRQEEESRQKITGIPHTVTSLKTNA